MFTTLIRRVMLAAAVTILAATSLQSLAESPPRPLSENETGLREWLLQVPELTLEDETGKVASTVIAEAKHDRQVQPGHSSDHAVPWHMAKNEARYYPPPIPYSLTKRWKVLGLEPIISADRRQRTPAEARALQAVALELRRHGLVSLPGRNGTIIKPDFYTLSGALTDAARRMSPDRMIEEPLNSITFAVPALVQMLCAEEEPLRLALVDKLSQEKVSLSTRELAHLAVYDLSTKVRQAALKELKKRPQVEYRTVFLEALDHPWAPVVSRAADALVKTRDEQTAAELRKLLDERDSTGSPFFLGDDNKPLVREVVRVNHLKNCLLCHTPSLNQDDLLRGLVTPPNQPLPVERFAYYEPARVPSPDDIFVRADITYLRQDFSVMLPVQDAKPWPDMQRFDFLVRTRPATAEEMTALKTRKGDSPQRQAILRVLEKLK